ncbi:MAG: hypothetical protein SVW02_00745 [Candidatus Nanohaloarchaea archaeon]|nr:hypothetical protein [Candidatus Nanohaloarchaea archaeon]
MTSTDDGRPDPETVAAELGTFYLDVSEDFLNRAYDELARIERAVGNDYQVVAAEDKIDTGRAIIDDYEWTDGTGPIDEAYTAVSGAVDDVQQLLESDDELPHRATALRSVRRLLVDSAEHLQDAREYRATVEDETASPSREDVNP